MSHTSIHKYIVIVNYKKEKSKDTKNYFLLFFLFKPLNSDHGLSQQDKQIKKI